MAFSVFLLVSVIFLLRINIINAATRSSLVSHLNRLFLGATLFLFFVGFTTMNYLLDYYQEVLMLSVSGSDLALLTTFPTARLLSSHATGLNLVEVYCYPFIYVFLLVTVLSIVFCLTYNTDELFSFMFYCQLILLAGYILFFTDSLILFFFAYEMLLVPSFFILYKFAKTRRCVEASYLMFF